MIRAVSAPTYMSMNVLYSWGLLCDKHEVGHILFAL
jgi:hypothetical protein